MTANTGKGRPPGSRNKLTLETLALVADGKTPVAFALGIMNDETKPQDVRLNAGLHRTCSCRTWKARPMIHAVT
jgi:hypothetical protein